MNHDAIAPEPTQAPDEKAKLYMASQWRLMWLKFKDHKLAVLALYVVLAFYVMAAFCEFLAPADPKKRDVETRFAPPQKIHLFHEGRVRRPFVYAQVQHIHPETLRLSYSEDKNRIFPIRFLVRGDPYRLWTLIPMRRHLIGLGPGEQIYLLGADRLGRDLLSRIMYGARISLSIGLVGVALSLILGIVIGGVSGFYGGWIDDLIHAASKCCGHFPRSRCGWPCPPPCRLSGPRSASTSA